MTTMAMAMTRAITGMMTMTTSRDGGDSDGDDDDDGDDCDITKRYELTCSTGLDNNVKNSADAILPIRMFVVVCICFAVKIASMVRKLPVTRINDKM